MSPRHEGGVSQEQFKEMVKMHKEMMEAVKELVAKDSSEIMVNGENQVSKVNEVSTSVGRGHPNKEVTRGQESKVSQRGNVEGRGGKWRVHRCWRCSKDHPGKDCKGKLVRCVGCGGMGHRAYKCYKRQGGAMSGGGGLTRSGVQGYARGGYLRDYGGGAFGGGKSVASGGCNQSGGNGKAIEARGSDSDYGGEDTKESEARSGGALEEQGATKEASKEDMTTGEESGMGQGEHDEGNQVVIDIVSINSTTIYVLMDSGVLHISLDRVPRIEGESKIHLRIERLKCSKGSHVYQI